MKRTELQRQTGLNETELDTLLNKLSQLPQWEGMIDTLSESVDDEIAQYIIANHSKDTAAIALKAANTQDRKGRFDSKKQQNETPTSMSISNAEYNQMDTTATDAIENMDEVSDHCRSNSQTFTEGMDSESLLHEELTGTVAGRLRAVTRIQAEADEYERIMLDHAEAQRNHSTAYTQQLFKRGQELTTNSTDERVKKQATNSTEFSNYANQLLGKLKR